MGYKASYQIVNLSCVKVMLIFVFVFGAGPSPRQDDPVSGIFS